MNERILLHRIESNIDYTLKKVKSQHKNVCWIMIALYKRHATYKTYETYDILYGNNVIM